MRIEFDPTNPTEAAAVRAMLTAMQPQEERRFAKRYVMTGTPMERGVLSEEIDHSSDATEPSEPSQDPETDSNGEPWDARIHSTPPTTNKDGTWRAKRGVKAEEIAAVKVEREAQQDDPEELERVEAEVKETLATEPPLAPAQEQTAPPAPNAPVGEQSAPPAPSAPPVTTAPPAPIATGSPSFLDVMKAITAAQKDGKIDTAKVKELCAAVGAGESTMGLNGPDNGDKRVAFMALLASETEGK